MNNKIFYILWTDVKNNKFNVNHVFADNEDEAKELFIEALSIKYGYYMYSYIIYKRAYM